MGRIGLGDSSETTSQTALWTSWAGSSGDRARLQSPLGGATLGGMRTPRAIISTNTEIRATTGLEPSGGASPRIPDGSRAIGRHRRRGRGLDSHPLPRPRAFSSGGGLRSLIAALPLRVRGLFWKGGTSSPAFVGIAGGRGGLRTASGVRPLVAVGDGLVYRAMEPRRGLG